MNVKNLVLGVGIFIVFLFVLHFGIESFYPSPQYNSYCSGAPESFYPSSYPVKIGIGGTNCSVSPTTREYDQCSAQGGMLIAAAYDAQDCPASFSCNLCAVHYTEADRAHSRVVFVIALIVGIIALIVGYGVLSVEPVGSALMASGVGAFVYGTLNNWSNLTNIWKFLLLLVALILLVWFALRLNSQKKKGFFGFFGKKRK